MNYVRKIIFVCGPAGIGKSTYCQGYIAAHPSEDVHIIASDEIRKSMTGSYLKFPPNHNMALVYGAMCDVANALYAKGNDVTIMLDTTMLTDERRRFFLDHLAPFEEKDLVLLKLHDYQIIYERNKKRIPEKWVPEDVIGDMIASYQDPSPDFAKNFTHVSTVYLD
jgi:predicted kinase